MRSKRSSHSEPRVPGGLIFLTTSLLHNSKIYHGYSSQGTGSILAATATTVSMNPNFLVQITCGAPKCFLLRRWTMRGDEDLVSTL